MSQTPSLVDGVRIVHNIDDLLPHAPLLCSYWGDMVKYHFITPRACARGKVIGRIVVVVVVSTKIAISRDIGV